MLVACFVSSSFYLPFQKTTRTHIERERETHTHFVRALYLFVVRARVFSKLLGDGLGARTREEPSGDRRAAGGGGRGGPKLLFHVFFHSIASATSFVQTLLSLLL